MSTGRKLFFFILGCKVLGLIAFVALFGADRLMWSDATTYLDLGKNIIGGKGFVSRLGAPNAIRTPLYPILIGFAYTYLPYGLVFIAFLQAVASAVVAWLVYAIALYFLRPAWAIGTAVLFAFEPISFLLHMLILPEAFLMLWFMAFLYFFLAYIESRQASHLLWSALFLALAMLTKPIVLYLFIVPVVFLLARKDTLRAMVFLAIILTLVASWMIRNYIVFGNLDISNDDVGNLCGYELPAVFATKYRKDPSNWDAVFTLPEFQEAHARCVSMRSALEIIVVENFPSFIKTTFFSTTAMLTNEGYAVFFEKPADQQVKIHHNYLTPAVFADAQWPSKIVAAARELTAGELGIVIVGKLFWIMLAVLAAVGAWKTVFLQRSFAGVFMLVTILYFLGLTVVSTGYGVGARLRHPINPALMIFAATILVRGRNNTTFRGFM